MSGRSEAVSGRSEAESGRSEAESGENPASQDAPTEDAVPSARDEEEAAGIMPPPESAPDEMD